MARKTAKREKPTTGEQPVEPGMGMPPQFVGMAVRCDAAGVPQEIARWGITRAHALEVLAIAMESILAEMRAEAAAEVRGETERAA
jgi:hypothetical protein